MKYILTCIIVFFLSDIYGQGVVNSINEYEKVKEKVVDRLIQYEHVDDDYIKIDDDFYENYLYQYKEFQLEKEYLELYYHSIPDIITSNFYMVLKAIYKYDVYCYSYYLIDIGNKNAQPFELAALYEYPDGEKQVKSTFLNDSTIRKIEVINSMGDYNKDNDSYDLIVDSITSSYRLRKENIFLLKKDSVRTIK